MTDRTVFYYRNVPTATSDYQVGPFNVDPCVKLFAARVRGSIVSGYGTLPVTGLKAVNDICWGLQHVIVGNTPLNLLTQQNDPGWLRIGQLQIGSTFDTFDNTITSIELGTLDPINYNWYGQLNLSGNVDFYISVAVPFSTGAGSSIDGSLEIISI